VNGEAISGQYLLLYFLTYLLTYLLHGTVVLEISGKYL